MISIFKQLLEVLRANKTMIEIFDIKMLSFSCDVNLVFHFYKYEVIQNKIANSRFSRNSILISNHSVTVPQLTNFGYTVNTVGSVTSPHPKS